MKEIRVGRVMGPATPERLDRSDEAVARVVRQINESNQSGGQWTEKRASANYTAAAWQIVLCDPTGGAFTVLLPDPTKCLGAFIITKNATTSTTAITVRAIGGANVDSQSSATMNTSLGSKWWRASTDGWWSL